MTVSQELTLLVAADKSYDDSITVTDVPKEQFIALTNETYTEPTRTFTVQLMNLQQSDGGTMTIGSGLFVREDGETSTKVIVLDTSGKQVAENTTDYPS